jgi:hypothetical protein
VVSGFSHSGSEEDGNPSTAGGEGAESQSGNPLSAWGAASDFDSGGAAF